MFLGVSQKNQVCFGLRPSQTPRFMGHCAHRGGDYNMGGMSLPRRTIMTRWRQGGACRV
jgi:hypothetical protein